MYNCFFLIVLVEFLTVSKSEDKVHFHIYTAAEIDALLKEEQVLSKEDKMEL
jgi:hypothetical protein